METTNFLSEHLYVLKQIDDTVNDIEAVDGKFAKIDVIYNLETADEIVTALASGFEKLNKLVLEYMQITSQIDPEYWEQLQRMLSKYEGETGLIERDENGDLHCGDCLVSYNYCRNIVGETVRISHITLNTNHRTRNRYKTFANQIDLVY